jgi:hypothetical protein
MNIEFCSARVDSVSSDSVVRQHVTVDGKVYVVADASVSTLPFEPAGMVRLRGRLELLPSPHYGTITEARIAARDAELKASVEAASVAQLRAEARSFSAQLDEKDRAISKLTLEIVRLQDKVTSLRDELDARDEEDEEDCECDLCYGPSDTIQAPPPYPWYLAGSKDDPRTPPRRVEFQEPEPLAEGWVATVEVGEYVQINGFEYRLVESRIDGFQAYERVDA